MNYLAGIAEILDWLEDEVGIVNASPTAANPRVRPAVAGAKLVWEPVEDVNVVLDLWLADADAVAGREVTSESFQSFIRHALGAVDEE